MRGWILGLRRRMRALRLKQWKRRRIIAQNLIRLGAKSKSAWGQIYKGNRGLWALSHTHIVDNTLDNRWFKAQGLISLFQEWQRLNPLPVTVASKPPRLGHWSSGIKPLLNNGKPPSGRPKSRM